MMFLIVLKREKKRRKEIMILQTNSVHFRNPTFYVSALPFTVTLRTIDRMESKWFLLSCFSQKVQALWRLGPPRRRWRFNVRTSNNWAKHKQS